MYNSPGTGASIDPIISRLRPRTVTELLDQAFRLYRAHFVTFVSIIAVVHVPLQLMITFGTALFVGDLYTMQDELGTGTISDARLNEMFSYLFVLYGVIIGVSILYSLLQKFAEGAMTAGVADSYLDRPVTFGSSYRQMFRHAWSLLGLIMLQLLIYVGVLLVPVLALVLSVLAGISSSDSGVFTGLFFAGCCLFVPAIAALVYIAVRLTATTPAVIVESLGPVQAIRRSWELARNYWWRTAGLLIVLGILQLVVQQGPAYLITAIAAIFAPEDFILQQVLSGFVSTMTTAIYLPMQLVAVTLYYFDLRVRKEGFDLDTAVSQRYAPPAWPGAPTAAMPSAANPPQLGVSGWYGDQGTPTVGDASPTRRSDTSPLDGSSETPPG